VVAFSYSAVAVFLSCCFQLDDLPIPSRIPPLSYPRAPTHPCAQATKKLLRLAIRWSAPQSAAHRGELRVTSARYSAGLRIPSAEWGAWVL